MADMDTKAIGGFYRLDMVNGQWTGRVLLAPSSNNPGDLVENVVPLF